ncbi:MAG: 30S ribosomal protein S9 [Candidatus Electrothrix sp. AW2]|mgnify:CR=1 FL=1|jgi:small subunit ribosomal protein S9|nr:30S ribosomal protein S9 [Candidatus Electrothrix sp. AX1]MCI5134543.1 30S ribosomal protein S9 [Candidatus Electrothrix gigas]MCW5211986.1 30S ribosomal protein S9 [Desulfobulbus sp. TB]MCI5178603.1 30S ribosomal protein S9 [Candidatus Electrothrix gigas]MCI5181094.1 30S ribosomal protein S9 [Candidatus Electrothrix gigas]
MAQEQTYATGKRKGAIARVWITPGSGNVVVNKLSTDSYFGNIFFEQKVDRPFAVTETVEQFDVQATVKGGGKSAQVDALVHGISRALQEVNPELRDSLKKAGLLTRDSRTKERKKYGQRGARARFQFSKR